MDREGRPDEIQIWNQARIEINWFPRMLCRIHVGIPEVVVYVSLLLP